MATDFDKEGFLVDLSKWERSVGLDIARAENIELTEDHWQVVVILRTFYKSTQVAPAMRPFVKLIETRLGKDMGNSITLMQLFGPSPAKTAAKIAGLPKPPNCL